jgi:hypothetical protein
VLVAREELQDSMHTFSSQIVCNSPFTCQRCT